MSDLDPSLSLFDGLEHDPVIGLADHVVMGPGT